VSTQPKVLLAQQKINQAVAKLAAEINRDYGDKQPLLIGILKGSFVFMSDLVRQLDLPLELDFVKLSSYGAGTRTSGKVKVVQGLKTEIKGRDVIVVEDIVDTGLTLRYLLNILSGRQPNSLVVCTFLDKATRRLVDIPVKYRCFEIPDRFVVGFGLDFNQRYRTLPCVGILKSQIYQGR